MATVVAARRGDPAAFARIVEHWDGHLRPFVHHSLGGQGSTDRVLAAAYVRAYRALPRYRGEITPGMWLHRIAYLSVTDELRRIGRDQARRRRRTEELMADAAAAEAAEAEAEAGARTSAAGPTPPGEGVALLDPEDPDLWSEPGAHPDDEPGAWDDDDPHPASTVDEPGSRPDEAVPGIIILPGPAPSDPGSTPGAGGPDDGGTGGPLAASSGDPSADDRSTTDVASDPRAAAEPRSADAVAAADPAVPPGWRRLAADQRALAVMVDLEGFNLDAAARAFDTSRRVVADRLGSARRVLARAGSRDLPEPITAPVPVTAGSGAGAVEIVEAPAPAPISPGPNRPGQVGGASIIPTVAPPPSAPAGTNGRHPPAPSDWTTTPGDEIEGVRLVEHAPDDQHDLDASTSVHASDADADATGPDATGGGALAGGPGPLGPTPLDPASLDAARAAAVAGLGGEEDPGGTMAAEARAVLAALPVPEPGERFWPDLGRRLLAERDTPAAPTIDPMARLAKSHPAEPGFHPRERRRRFGRKGRPPREVAELASPAVTTLADQADWVRPRRRWTSVLGLLALLAIVAGLVVIAVKIGTSERIPDGSVSGPSLGADVSEALGQGPFQQVDARVEEPARAGAATGSAATRRVRFILGVDGSWVVSARDRIDQATYDAARGVVRRVAVVGEGAEQTVVASETTGLASGAPDPEAAPPEELSDLQAVVAILRGAGGRRATATTSGTTPTWTLRRTLPTGAGGSREDWRIVVRRADALPILVERRAGDALVRRTTFTGWKLVTQVAADTFAQPLPANVAVTTTAHAFLTTDLATVPMLGRGGAITPSWLPTGFELTTITVRAEAPPDAPSTAGGKNPADVAVLSLGFRKGPLHITVSTRSRGTTGDAWVDPFGTTRGTTTGASGDGTDARTLDDGLFNGLRVQVGTDAVGRSRLWGTTAPGTGGPEGVVLTVAGDLTPTEAVRLAASLR